MTTPMPEQTPDAAPVTVDNLAAVLFEADPNNADGGSWAEWLAYAGPRRILSKVTKRYEAMAKAVLAALVATPSDRARVDGEVTQEDREAAAKLQEWNGDDMALAARMLGGREDDHPYVVAFRDHRQAAEQRALAAEKELETAREANRLMAEQCMLVAARSIASEQRVRERADNAERERAWSDWANQSPFVAGPWYDSKSAFFAGFEAAEKHHVG